MSEISKGPTSADRPRTVSRVEQALRDVIDTSFMDNFYVTRMIANPGVPKADIEKIMAGRQPLRKFGVAIIKHTRVGVKGEEEITNISFGEDHYQMSNKGVLTVEDSPRKLSECEICLVKTTIAQTLFSSEDTTTLWSELIATEQQQ